MRVYPGTGWMYRAVDAYSRVYPPLSKTGVRSGTGTSPQMNLHTSKQTSFQKKILFQIGIRICRHQIKGENMAGFPIRRALEKKIEEMGGIEFVCAHVAQGMTLNRLAEFIECSRPMLSFWINHTEERRVAVLNARKLKAEKLAEEALEIADQSDETSNSGVNKARLQVDTRKWLAGKLDPEAYGDTAKTQVNISMGDLHLQALKHMGKVEVVTLENNE
jgi:hypothetical protein